ncbi:YceI family protein [Sinomicrobium soli]|uniref:YceI family protein n=1 Tax=Sinomicrobium sp. N-1-3-6 TaxID=2219864 RepID=UPI000DCF2F9F|nr:YceI family protein [Sinomicrobium sp. N-1-3-6]RAV29063.1 YceI family protein [Sinomicrobium sp. N-1-3-6]
MRKTKKSFLKIAITLMGVFSFISVSTAQEMNAVPSKSKVEVFGTSNVHDWELTADAFMSSGEFKVAGNVLESVEKLRFTIAVEALKSGKGGMDKNTYKALNSGKHPEISFVAGTVTDITEVASGKYTVSVPGKLTIAGTARQVTLKFEVSSAQGINLSGSTEIDMTDYGVEPPTALLGTIKTGEKVTVKVNIAYQ